MIETILKSSQSDAEKIQALEKVVLDCQAELGRVYPEIGLQYVALHRKDYEAEFAALFAAVEKAENTVRECHAAVRELKGVVCCEQCGNDVPKTSAFCSVCGKAMPGFEAPVIGESQIRCAVCGKMVDKSSRFCTSCGMILTVRPENSNDTAVPAVEEIVPPVEEIVPAVEEIVVPVEEIVEPEETEMPAEETSLCTRCAKPLKNGMAFCVYCGQQTELVRLEKRFCIHCGKEAAQNARFCTGCGKSL